MVAKQALFGYLLTRVGAQDVTDCAHDNNYEDDEGGGDATILRDHSHAREAGRNARNSVRGCMTCGRRLLPIRVALARPRFHGRLREK